MTPELGPPIDVLEPSGRPGPLVISSPHSGCIYPPSLLAQVAVGLEQLRRLEDGCVDRLFDCAPGLGAPLLRARFARAYVDPNREAFELDPAAFREPLPDYVNAGSLKARAGLGTLPTRVGGRPIYRGRLSFAEAERRIELAYWPYHRALQRLLMRARTTFGAVLLLDCHSMPTLSAGAGARGIIDIALGDRYGRTCAPRLIEQAERLLRRRGLRVARNQPYAGGYITARYGEPEAGVHALQIEVRRDLYMDERDLRARPAMGELKAVVRELLLALLDVVADGTRPAMVAEHRVSAGAGGF